MRSVVYQSGTGFERIELNGGSIAVGAPNSLHSRAWAYDVEYRGISGVSRKSRKETVSMVAEKAAADRFAAVCDRDVQEGTPGKLHIGDWWQRCYVVEIDTKEIARRMVSLKLTVILVDGVWRRGKTFEFSNLNEGEESDDLDMPYDLPHDLALVPMALESIEGGEWGESAMLITVYGSAINPAVVIGGNVYKVNVEVPAGSRLEIDGIGRTVKLIGDDGTVKDCFGDAERGSGKDGGSYIFQPLPIGASSVSWDKSFSFFVTVYEESGAPGYAE